MIAGAAGTGYGAYIAALGMIGGIGGTVFGGGAAALAIGSVAVGVGALIAVGGIHVSAQASANLKKDLDEYWKSRLNEVVLLMVLRVNQILYMMVMEIIQGGEVRQN